MPNCTFRELTAWKKSIDLVVRIYEETRGFPREEVHGLTAQLRRAAVSIPSNIAEGQGRRTTAEFRQFLSVAYGSLRELETQLTIASRLGYLVNGKDSELFGLAGEVGRLLNGLRQALQRQLVNRASTAN